MTDESLPTPYSEDDQAFLASAGIAVSVQPEGVLVSGDDVAVADYLARIKDLAGDAVQVTGVDKTSFTSAAAVAGAAATNAVGQGQFVRLSPESLKMLQSYRVMPGTGGYNRMTVVDASHKFRGQMQWQSVSMTPTRALGVQLLAVQIALQTAVQSVADAVERVQGTVDKILVLAQASQVGDVVGNHEALSRIAKVHGETGALPTADWDSIASLGPVLEVGIARLREHAKRTVAGFDAQKPVQDRASYLKNAVEDKRLGETLQLLVIAEQSLYLWQKMRIERVRATEPEHLETVVKSARALLLEHFERDGEILSHARSELANYATVKPLEIVRWISTSDLKRDISSLRQDLDDFASARGSQVAGWIEHEDPSISDALAEVGNRAKAVGGAAVAIGGKAADIGASGLGWIGRSLQNVASSRGKDESSDAKPPIEIRE